MQVRIMGRKELVFTIITNLKAVTVSVCCFTSLRVASSVFDLCDVLQTLDSRSLKRILSSNSQLFFCHTAFIAIATNEDSTQPQTLQRSQRQGYFLVAVPHQCHRELQA